MDSLSTTPTIPPSYHEIPQIMFSWIDFALFALMLALSAAIGIYYGFCGAKQDTANEYLLGGKTMKVFPIAMSLIASFTSSMTLLAVPADIYKYGGAYWWICVGILITCIVSSYVFMPVFLKLQLTSAYEYLKIRFDSRIRVFASFLYTLSIILYNPIVIYVPALAFSQATGYNLHLITPVACIICIFYTTVGGLKAVVWTDTLQTMAIAGSITAVFFMGVASAGGFSNVWQKSVKGHRLDIIDFQLDPTRRDSVWALVIGGGTVWICNFAISQAAIQRFLAVRSMERARSVVVIFCVGMLLIKTVNVLTGLIIFTKYSDCDPLTTKQISRNDQLLPYYVMDVAGKIPGLPGLFIAGVFSAGLSTLSTTLNTVSGTIYEDFISPFMPADITQKQTSNIMKLIVVIAGIISTALVFVVEHLGGVLPLVVSLGGITNGPLLGLFCLGMLFPKANAKGALFGGVASLIFSTWMILGNQLYKRMGLLEDFAKSVSTEGCNFYTNTTPTINPPPTEQPFVLYRISFWYYTVLGTVVVIITGLVVSWFTSKDDPPVHPDLISPVAQFLLPKEIIYPPLSSDYLHVDRALHMISLNSEK